MAFTPEHQKYHQLGPKDVGLSTEKKQVAIVDIARTTNHSGEQFHVAVPVYSDDSREELQTRVQFFLSLIQDRLEEENRAMIAINEKNQKIRMVETSIKRNTTHFQTELKKLVKRAKREKWEEADFVAERTKLVEGLKEANEKLVNSLESEEDKKSISLPVPESLEEGHEVVQ